MVATLKCNAFCMKIKFACLKSCILDFLDRPDLDGAWEEIWCSFEYITKLGYFLEQSPAVDKKYIEKFRLHMPKYLNKVFEKSGSDQSVINVLSICKISSLSYRLLLIKHSLHDRVLLFLRTYQWIFSLIKFMAFLPLIKA